MNNRADAEAVRRRMEQLRAELGHNVHETIQTARTMLDWRYYVRKHPWACMVAAAASGFLIVPRARQFVQPDPDALVELAKAHRLVVASPPAAVARGGLGGTILNMAINAFARGTVNYLAQRADRLVRSSVKRT